MKSSCDEYKEIGEVSGIYTIDPDGSAGNVQSFEVYCDMDSDPEGAITKMG